jgi:hypothetical protein
MSSKKNKLIWKKSMLSKKTGGADINIKSNVVKLIKN